MPHDAATLIDELFRDEIGARVIANGTDAPTGRAIAAALGATDCIVAPITGAGEVIGLVAVVNRIGEAKGFRAQDGTVFATLANHASVALENGRLLARLHDQAHQLQHDAVHDALTTLPNRIMFGDRLRDATVRGTEVVGVAVMDLDGFKDINDTLGHEARDRVLVEVAHRIVSTVDPSIFVARLGGDEFALLFSDASRRDDLESVGRQVRAALAVPMQVEGVRVNISISVCPSTTSAPATRRCRTCNACPCTR